MIYNFWTLRLLWAISTWICHLTRKGITIIHFQTIWSLQWKTWNTNTYTKFSKFTWLIGNINLFVSFCCTITLSKFKYNFLWQNCYISETNDYSYCRLKLQHINHYDSLTHSEKWSGYIKIIVFTIARKLMFIFTSLGNIWNAYVLLNVRVLIFISYILHKLWISRDLNQHSITPHIPFTIPMLVKLSVMGKTLSTLALSIGWQWKQYLQTYGARTKLVTFWRQHCPMFFFDKTHCVLIQIHWSVFWKVKLMMIQFWLRKWVRPCTTCYIDKWWPCK